MSHIELKRLWSPTCSQHTMERKHLLGRWDPLKDARHAQIYGAAWKVIGYNAVIEDRNVPAIVANDVVASGRSKRRKVTTHDGDTVAVNTLYSGKGMQINPHMDDPLPQSLTARGISARAFADAKSAFPAWVMGNMTSLLASGVAYYMYNSAENRSPGALAVMSILTGCAGPTSEYVQQATSLGPTLDVLGGGGLAREVMDSAVAGVANAGFQSVLRSAGGYDTRMISDAVVGTISSAVGKVANWTLSKVVNMEP